MKEIDEKGVIAQLKGELVGLQKKMGNLQGQARDIDEHINRLQFDLAKKQGAIEEFERLVLGKNPKQETPEKPLVKEEKKQ